MAIPSVTGSDLIVSALLELGILYPGETPEGSIADFCLQKGNRLIDNWNAAREAIYTDEFLTFTLIANTQPLTIGPSSANFTTTHRPVSIEAANVILNNVSPTVRVPLTVHSDPQWWMSVSVPGTTSKLSSDLYYQPTWPNGNIYLWCKQNYPYTLELLVRKVLAELAFTTVILVPQGYWDALVLTLAEDLAAPLKRVPSGVLRQKAREARARIFDNNTIVPSIQTQDAGMPSGQAGSHRSNWNYLSGTVNGRFGS